MTTPAVLVEGRRVAYGTAWALAGVDVEVARGSALGVLVTVVPGGLRHR